MKSIRTSILPTNQQFINVYASHKLNLKAICIYAAIGFFMDDDTFWKDEVCLLPGHDHMLDAQGFLVKSTPNFKWYYEPEPRSFDEVLEAYAALLTQIVQEQVGNHRVILPLSGGLDSRSLALVLKTLGNSVQAFSYRFTQGYPEDRIAKQIAHVCDFDFEAFKIPKNYLWDSIDELATINQCYSDFTHPRQMAVLPQLKQMHGVFCLGHWGDVLFDRGVPEGTKEDDLSALLLKKMVKSSGMVLAEQLWEVWGLEGQFKDYLVARIETALSKIDIKNPSAKARAFKTNQWAHRWTTTNLQVFAAAHPVVLPYYDDRMLEFICKVPEAYLADRRLQLAHLKQNRALSRITWQAQRPFNLYTYKYNKVPYNLPYRFVNKLQRDIKGMFGKPYIQRNWELQFLGKDNAMSLEHYLFDPNFLTWIPESLVKTMYGNFVTKNPVSHAHAVSMLLILSVWHKRNKDI